MIQPVTADGLTVSSTKVREFLLEGNVEGAAVLLGRAHDVEASGRARRRPRAPLGFATANLRPEGLLPRWGSTRPGPAGGRAAPRRGRTAGARTFDAVCNVGVKPTVEESGPVRLEAHLLGHDGSDLYGRAAPGRVRGPHPARAPLPVARRAEGPDRGRRPGGAATCCARPRPR